MNTDNIRDDLDTLKGGAASLIADREALVALRKVLDKHRRYANPNGPDIMQAATSDRNRQETDEEVVARLAAGWRVGMRDARRIIAIVRFVGPLPPGDDRDPEYGPDVLRVVRSLRDVKGVPFMGVFIMDATPEERGALLSANRATGPRACDLAQWFANGTPSDAEIDEIDRTGRLAG